MTKEENETMALGIMMKMQQHISKQVDRIDSVVSLKEAAEVYMEVAHYILEVDKQHEELQGSTDD